MQNIDFVPFRDREDECVEGQRKSGFYGLYELVKIKEFVKIGVELPAEVRKGRLHEFAGNDY